MAGITEAPQGHPGGLLAGCSWAKGWAFAQLSTIRPARGETKWRTSTDRILGPPISAIYCDVTSHLKTQQHKTTAIFFYSWSLGVRNPDRAQQGGLASAPQCLEHQLGRHEDCAGEAVGKQALSYVAAGRGGRFGNIYRNDKCPRSLTQQVLFWKLSHSNTCTWAPGS